MMGLYKIVFSNDTRQNVEAVKITVDNGCFYFYDRAGSAFLIVPHGQVKLVEKITVAERLELTPEASEHP